MVGSSDRDREKLRAMLLECVWLTKGDNNTVNTVTSNNNVARSFYCVVFFIGNIDSVEIIL